MTRTTVDLEVITKAIALDAGAPSSHNSQPWRWIVGDAEVDLFSDQSRTVRSTDNSGREMVVSCGAALGHFRVAMAAVGWDTNVDRFPNPNDLNHLATADFSPAHCDGVVPPPCEARRRRAVSPARDLSWFTSPSRLALRFDWPGNIPSAAHPANPWRRGVRGHEGN
jgi:nitroreductase